MTDKYNGRTPTSFVVYICLGMGSSTVTLDWYFSDAFFQLNRDRQGDTLMQLDCFFYSDKFVFWGYFQRPQHHALGRHYLLIIKIQSL